MRDFKILELPNVLSDSECRHLIHFHKTHQHMVTYNDAAEHYNGRRIAFESIRTHHIRNLMRKVQFITIAQIYGAYQDQIYPEQAEIMRWQVGMDQNPHIDKMADPETGEDIYPETAWASILYLNDNYDGGKTYFEPCPELPMGFEIEPQAGKLVMFQGMEFYHGVTKVRRAERYTLPFWYTRNVHTMTIDIL